MVSSENIDGISTADVNKLSSRYWDLNFRWWLTAMIANIHDVESSTLENIIDWCSVHPPTTTQQTRAYHARISLSLSPLITFSPFVAAALLLAATNYFSAAISSPILQLSSTTKADSHQRQSSAARESAQNDVCMLNYNDFCGMIKYAKESSSFHSPPSTHHSGKASVLFLGEERTMDAPLMKGVHC